MRRLPLLPVLLAAACAPRGVPPGTPSSVTLLGDRGRLETWEARSLSGGHLHARGDEGTCSAAAELLRAGAGILATLPGENREAARRSGETLATAVEGLCATLFGRGYGGKGRLVLSLRPPPPDGRPPEEALFVVVPEPAEGGGERAYGPSEILAEYLSPLDRVEAVLERGRVLVRRSPDGSREIELFLVLRPRVPAPYERLQVVARIETR